MWTFLADKRKSNIKFLPMVWGREGNKCSTTLESKFGQILRGGMGLSI